MIVWIRLKALIIKEFLAVWRNKKSRIMLFAPPLIQLIVLSQALTLDVTDISLGVHNTDGGWYSHELIQRIKGAPYFTRVFDCKNHQDIRNTIDNQKALVVIHIQSNFSRLISKGKQASIQIILDGRKSNASQIVAGYLSTIINTFNNDILYTKGVGAHPFVDIQSRVFFNPNLDYIYYVVPTLVAMLSMLLALTVTAMSVSRERESGTFDQLLVSPLQPWEILVGKTIPAMAISITESTLLMGISLILFKVPFVGSLLLLYVSMFVFLLANVGVGLFISSISYTQQQSLLGSFMFILPTMLLSGYATPIENMPSWLQPATTFVPITHFLIIIKGIFLKDISAFDVWKDTWPMLLIAMGTLSAAGWMFKRRLE